MEGREELKQKIERAIRKKCVAIADVYATNKLIPVVMEAIDEFIEEGDTADSSGKEGSHIDPRSVYVGMRIRMVKEQDDPDNTGQYLGEEATVVVPDTDGVPGVVFDSDHLNTMSPDVREVEQCWAYIDLEYAEKIDDTGT